MVIEPRYRIGHIFSEGVASVQVGDKWGYIDQKGEVAIKPQFDLAYPFSNGVARVEVGMCASTLRLSERESGECNFGYINKQGKYIWRPSK
ncbi:MAG: WG repeat-containing protein [Blastocatellia bacterium]|nr:WG repeat-containing protein [Blastocatellia bacterium]